MLNYLQAEILKQKHHFSLKLLWIAPTLTVLLVIVMMAGTHLQDGAYNWWYTMLLPGSFTIFIALSTAGERRKNRHGLFSVAVKKKQLWFSQILFYTLYLLATCSAFFLTVTIVSFIFGGTIGFKESALASFLLVITNAWQIPLWMVVTEKAGKFIAVLLSLLCNFGLAVPIAVGDAWWIPFSIPARLMCAVIGVLPNGLPVEESSALASSVVILPGALITIALYLALSMITAIWFEQKEV